MLRITIILVLCSLELGICHWQKSPIPKQVNRNGSTKYINIPYLAQLIQVGNNSFLCGAAIISKKHVLTAASCIKTKNASYQVLVGFSERGKRQKHGVSHIKLHPGFKQQTFENDIAILKLKNPLRFDRDVRKINLSTHPIEQQKIAISYGFPPPNTKNLKPLKVTVTVIPVNQCRMLIGKNLHESKICTHCFNCSSCQSHSGELLVKNEKLIGLVSRHSRCERPDLPAIYTSINSVHSFIKKEIKILRDSKKKKDGKVEKGMKGKKGKKPNKGKEVQLTYYVGISKAGGKIFCGGALISQMHFLTAGECMRNKIKFEAHIGSEKIPITKTLLLSKKKEKTPLFTWLAWLWRKIHGVERSGSALKPIALPKKNEKYKDGAKATIVGYGLLNKGGKPSTKVTATSITLLNKKQCKKLVELPNNGLCAGDPKRGNDPCKGDLGGPVVLDNKLIGISMTCGKKSNPIVFEDVRPLVDIIFKITKNFKQ